MCKAFLPAEREINLALSGGEAFADCTSTRRSGVQDLMCDLRPVASTGCSSHRRGKASGVRLQLLCFRAAYRPDALCRVGGRVFRAECRVRGSRRWCGGGQPRATAG